MHSIRNLGPHNVSSLLSVRLVAAIIFAYILLGEKVDKLAQIIGIVVVVLTVSWFLYMKKRDVDKKMKMKETETKMEKLEGKLPER